MDFINSINNSKGALPEKGKLLIAEPFLNDSDFTRSVVFLCEHNDDGTIGFVLNQPTSLILGDLLIELDNNGQPLLIYNGGPVQNDTLHIMHRIPEVLGGIEVASGIFWGGSLESLKVLIKGNSYKESDLRLFIGYSGWSAGQLAKEMESGTWLVGEVTEELFFDTAADTLWKKAVNMLGKDFAFLANMPIDPQLN